MTIITIPEITKGLKDATDRENVLIYTAHGLLSASYLTSINILEELTAKQPIDGEPR